MERRVLFLQPDNLTCYRVQRGSAILEQQWHIQQDRLPVDLRSWLSRNRPTEFNLLIDLPEEECHLESFKSIGRLDQKHLIAKLQNKRFENALLSKSAIASKGSNFSLLLSGVAKQKICADLIRQLEQAEVCIRAIHSPLTLASVLTKLSHSGKGPCLFVIPLAGCYRLLACVNSFVFFNRRIVALKNSKDKKPESGQKEADEALRGSLTETLVYLQRQNLEGWDTPQLIVPGAAQAAGSLKMLFTPLADAGLVTEIRDFQSGLVDRAQPAEKSRLLALNKNKQVQMRKSKPDSSDLELTHVPPLYDRPLDVQQSPDKLTSELMLVTAASRCGNGYATKTHRRSYTTRKVRNICAALAVCGVGGAVSSAAVARKITGHYDELAATYARSSMVFQDAAAGNDPLHEHSVEAVRQAMVTAKLIRLGSVHTPMDFLKELAGNVRQLSDVSVNSVQWENEDLLNDSSLTKMLIQPAIEKTLDVQQVYRATVSGVIKGHPDSALTTFESFVSTLRGASADSSVVVIETPFGLGNQDRTTTSSLSDEVGNFVLELSSKRVER